MSSEEQVMKLYGPIETFKCHLKKRGYSPNTIRDQCKHIRAFTLYLEDIGIGDVREVTLPVLREYQKELYWKNSAYGRPYTPHTLVTKICALRSYFRYLLAENLILTNPALYLKLPKPDRIPRNVLSLSEAEALLSQPGRKTFQDIRDKAILELFYSTGIRRQELIDLNVMDVDLKQEVLFIRKGKGGNDRVVPLGKWASRYLKKYLEKRKKVSPDEKALFLCERGLRRVSYSLVGQIVKVYAERAYIGKKISCHTLRHTCAVHFLEGGADLRSVQELLGHRNIGTTQIYLKVSQDELKKVHKKCHPRGKMGQSGNNIW